MLLQQRNLNDNVNHNYKCGFKLYTTAPVIENVYAAFWPSCSDMDPLATTCNLCRHHLSLRNPFLAEPFAENEMEAIEMPDPADGSDASGASDVTDVVEESESGGREAPLVRVAPEPGVDPVWPEIMGLVQGPYFSSKVGLLSSPPVCGPSAR